MEGAGSREQRTNPTKSLTQPGKENNQELSSADDLAGPKKAPVEPETSSAEHERPLTKTALSELV